MTKSLLVRRIFTNKDGSIGILNLVCRELTLVEIPFQQFMKKDGKLKNFLSHFTYEGRLTYPIELFYSTTFPTLFFVDSKNESFLREPIYY